MLRPVFSAIRAYVLSRRKAIGFIVLALSLSPVGANLVSEYQFLVSAFRWCKSSILSGSIWIQSLWSERPTIWMSRDQQHDRHLRAEVRFSCFVSF